MGPKRFVYKHVRSVIHRRLLLVVVPYVTVLVTISTQTLRKGFFLDILFPPFAWAMSPAYLDSNRRPELAIFITTTTTTAAAADVAAAAPLHSCCRCRGGTRGCSLD